MKVIDPATEEEIAYIEAADVGPIVQKAKRALESWRPVSPGARAKLLRRFASVVYSHIDELAAIEVRNSGHTLGNARWEAGNVRDLLE